MRVSQVYRWQIPMDAGVVLRERRLKTRDGLFIRLQEGEREGWGEISPCRDSVSRRWKRRKWRC
ncbi:O-succinylbenzoate synthase [Klebsiella pneumoniae subsp. pneumoniae KpMDU1]|nr:O-succinylbenzoate synthase [Klebsiella pneumoniae subsp. pneumoniae KpMDU1]CDK96963.1 O-succinylbenzoate synthase [Klebsiella pneumoniae IS33]